MLFSENTQVVEILFIFPIIIKVPPLHEAAARYVKLFEHTMHMRTLIIILFLSLISCNEKRSNSSLEDNDNSVYKINYVESFEPENIESETQDTIIKKGNFKVSITHTYLETFEVVKSQYRDFVDVKKLKYQTINRTLKIRNEEIQLKISQNSKPILDTIFHKEQFKDYLSKSDLKKSIRIIYYFEELLNGKLAFRAIFDNGSLKLHQKVYLIHYYDIQTKTFEIKQQMNL